MHVFVFKWFFEVARIAISVDFCYSITRVETALQLCLRKPKLCHKVFKEKRESFSCLPHEVHVSSCSKGSLVHHFCGQSASSFSRLFFVIIRDEVTLQIWLYNATTCYQGNFRTALTVYSLQNTINVFSCSKGSIIHLFFELTL